MPGLDPTTVVHVTHEAVHKIGGIGTVLEGLLNAAAYRRQIGRSLLVGPLWDHGGAGPDRLGPGGTVLYSSLDRLDEGGWAAKLGPVVEEYRTGIVYGRRPLVDEWTGERTEAEVLLVDVAGMEPRRLAEFKFRLFETYGLASDRYEFIWDFEQYVRLARPGLAAVGRLLGDAEAPVVIQAHEYMGVPFALAAQLSGDPRFVTVFHAHETATVRRIVEEHPGHDTRFYRAMHRFHPEGRTLDEVFGSQDGFFKHALCRAGRHLDGVFAVGELVRKELQFLDPGYGHRPIDFVPNGVPAVETSLEERQTSRRRLVDYAERLLGWRPGHVFTHVARLVSSKAFWRDVRVLVPLDARFAATGRSAVLFVLATEGAQRSSRDVRRLAAESGWPWTHRVGYPDLTGSEIGLDASLQAFNRASRAIKIVFVNQFGWSPEALGPDLPDGTTFVDLRRGTDLEFGQSIYEPFGISQLEPLTFGALCVPSAVCGCVAFARARSGRPAPADLPNIVVGDYVGPPDGGDPLAISRGEREALEDQVALDVAGRIEAALAGDVPAGDRLARGRDLARRMSWEAVAADFYLPALASATRRSSRRGPGPR